MLHTRILQKTNLLQGKVHSHKVASGPGRRRRQAQALSAPVKLHIVPTHEDVTQDPEGGVLSSSLNPQLADRAGAVDDEIFQVEHEGLAAHYERDARQLDAALHHP